MGRRGNEPEVTEEAQILIVAAKPAQSTALCRELAAAGYRPVLCADPNQAILQSGQATEKLVLLDTAADGGAIPWLERLRRNWSHDELPVILIGDNPSGDEVLAAVRAGANDYVAREAGANELKNRIAESLERAGRRQKVVGGYRLIEEIGAGAMGSVYVADNLASQTRVALKILPEALTIDPLFVQRFHQEAQLIARLRHRNIVRWLDSGVSGSTHYIAMELIEGHDFEEACTARPFSVGEALLLARQLASALNQLHKKDILHRDVKPANIMLTHDGAAKLVDFGIARDTAALSRLTKSGLGLGSLSYCSPEQMRGNADARSDIYSLGCTLYFMLTGEAPYDATGSIDEIWDLKLKKPPRPSALVRGIPPAVDDLVTSLMAGKPSKRPKNAAAVMNRVDDLLSLRYWHAGYTPRRLVQLGLVVAVGLAAMSVAVFYLRSIGYF